MVSLTEENYLKALLSLSADKGEVGINELSRHLGIKMPTANSMMKKLSEKNLVHYVSYKPLRLTEKGRREAALIVRKHRLTEMFLVEKMGFGWEQVHEIAEQVEHIHSNDFFEKMDELLGFPKFDPHGSPIPDKNGKMEWVSYEALAACEKGATVKLAAVLNAGDDFLKYLNSRELKLGVKLKILSIEPFDKSMVVAYGKRPQEVLSALVCERLLVSR
ncbi:metal-dependent transcriptional regulator [Rurimicrobium arvi]|uniref:Transcriptional regulator MntR n=1 Tax=Rurimicrobium arvi TaxID=2049916 RepID=A0ABP8MIC4_9BACT